MEMLHDDSSMLEEPQELVMKLCCTCLSKDRTLHNLCVVPDGVNNLYSLLSSDSEAYREVFFRDASNLLVCWECKAQLSRVVKFRSQACLAQKHLTNLLEGRNEKESEIPLTQLGVAFKTKIDYMYVFMEHTAPAADSHGGDISLEPIATVKTENEDDMPLSEFLSVNNFSDIDSPAVSTPQYDSDDSDGDPNAKKKKKKKKRKKQLVKIKNKKEAKDKIPKMKKEKSDKTDKIDKENGEKKIRKSRGPPKKLLTPDEIKNYYTTVVMSEQEMIDSRDKRRLVAVYSEASYKCEHCIEGFRNQVDLVKHNLDVHYQKCEHTQCPVCKVYIYNTYLTKHMDTHYKKQQCLLCESVYFKETDILNHLRNEHGKKTAPPVTKKRVRKPQQKNATPQARAPAMMDKRTPYGYQCPECSKYFETKRKRRMHIQRAHRTGFECARCGKRFQFKLNLAKHEKLHQGPPPPREECPICHKMVRCDLIKRHVQIHTERQRFECNQCGKKFVSRQSFEHHLKYTRAHAAVDVRKFKCSACDKAFKSRTELRDHVNYQHMGRTTHQCPVCGKALATAYGVTRHVMRAHHGVKDRPLDNICQQCGKAFRYKKGLREHELIHTGERPLSCEICGHTFRQNSSLYTHKKRVHNVFPPKKDVIVVSAAEIQQ